MMSIKKIFFLLMGCLYTILCAQGENDNWYFGDRAAINFSSATTSTALNNSQMTCNEAVGTASDISGNLLFYCNPQTIWNRQHQTMLNGTGLAGGLSSQQLAIVKNPANPNQYYVFVTPEVENSISATNKLSYSIVDMSLGPIVGGTPLGAVLQNFKNISVVDNLGNNFRSEAITVVSGSSPNTYWVLIPSGNNLYSYKIDNSGFSNGAPVVSSLNFPGNLNSNSAYSIKASPKLNNQNFSNFVCISLWGEYYNNNPPIVDRVYSFNSNTGLITNTYSLTINSIRSYLPEFNRDGSVLFLANRSIFAVDLVNSTTGNINSLQIFNGSSEPINVDYTPLQRNKYGNIYISRRLSDYLGIINNPNVFGPNMSVTMNSIYLNTGYARYGLPQLIPESVPIDYYPCIDSLTLTYEPNLNFNYEVGNKIITKTKYSLGPRHNITMKAGNIVNLLPGTEMQVGANYHAYIAPCREKNSDLESKNLSQTGMILDLDKVERSKNLTSDNVTISPNPASDFINIDSGKEQIISWELFDISARSVLKGNSSQVNVQSLPKANYILKINTVNKQVTKKVTVK